MYLTKPAGIFFQLFGFIIGVGGIGLTSQGGASIFFGIILALLGGWMFWRGRRTKER